ncbi:MAG: DUF2752 domain-containing protein [Micropruina sp.]|uniref:DUF2752 domain-containing protein n=1 Tax=Micropruina sp. TaxID=2737536 RepID=UPI0039E5F4D3
MSTVGVTGQSFSASRAVRSLAAFGAVGVGLSALALTTGAGVPCPWRELTGTLCPLCGGTHLGMALLRGDLTGAWAANSFVFAALAVLAGLGALWTVEALGGPAVRPPRALRWTSGRWWLLIGVVALVFAVVRNL